MVIKILGTGCSNCKRLEANAQKAVEGFGIAGRMETGMCKIFRRKGNQFAKLSRIPKSQNPILGKISNSASPFTSDMILRNFSPHPTKIPSCN